MWLHVGRFVYVFFLASQEFCGELVQYTSDEDTKEEETFEKGTCSDSFIVFEIAT